MANFIKGDVAILSIFDGTAYRPVACLTSNSLSTSLSVIETVTKCDPGETIKTAGTSSYNISAEGNYIDTTSVGGDTAKASHDYLFTRQQAKDVVIWKLSTGLADTSDYYGSAIITDLEADFPTDGELATFSATFEGSGAIVTIDPS